MIKKKRISHIVVCHFFTKYQTIENESNMTHKLFYI